jgi:hypothetical protein
MWWEYLLVFGAGFFCGLLTMAMCAMARDSDRAIDRILRGGK